MKWRYIAIVLSLLLLATSCKPSQTLTEKEVAKPEPTLAIPIRGVVLSSGLDAELVRQLKDMGVNWIEMILWVAVTEEGELIPCREGVSGPPKGPPYSQQEVAILKSELAQTEEMMIQRIKQAHENGFKVFLVTYHERMGAHDDYGANLRINVDSFLGQAKDIALEWARICEENEVEMFAPCRQWEVLPSFPGSAYNISYTYAGICQYWSTSSLLYD